MKLSATLLGGSAPSLLSEITSGIALSQCDILEIRAVNLTESAGLYLAVTGGWSHLAKLEALLDALAKRHQLQLQFTRSDEMENSSEDGVPFLLEIISPPRKEVLSLITQFLLDKGVLVEDLQASRYRNSYFANLVLTARFILFVPESINLLSLREEFLDYCDEHNIDSIFEPIKR
jgi:glycine cleavage system transcriptional repressor